MTVYKDLSTIEQMPETCVALGYFDGIHAGHQALIERCVADARERGVKSAVFTFSNSPKAALRELMEGTKASNKAEPTALMTWDEKVAAVEALGVDYLIAPAFDRTIMSMSPEAFVRELLVGACNMTDAYCGFNYSFGHKAAGKPEDLLRMGEEGIETTAGVLRRYSTFIQEPYKIDGTVVSSTVIRGLVSEGKIEEANRFLGHRFSLEGDVEPGRHIGTGIGFPTANFDPDASLLLPPEGVYVTLAEIDGVTYEAVSNVGKNPTIEWAKDIPRCRVETHIIGLPDGADGKAPVLYGKHIRVFFAKRIRGEVRFANLNALKNRIALDKGAAYIYWKEHER